MANAFLLEPLQATATDGFGSLQTGSITHLFNDYAGVVCQLACNAGLNAAAVQFDLGADRALDTILVFGLAGLPASALFTVTYATDAQGPSTDGVPVTTPQPAYAGDAGDRGIALWSGDTSISARYVRLTFYAGATGYAMRASRIVAGKRIQLERNFSFGAEFGVKDLGAIEFSRRGVLLRNRGAKLRTTSLTFSSVRRDEVEQLTAPLLQRIGNTECVALVTDPAPHPQRQNRCYFGPLVGDLGQTWRRANAWEAKINMVSLF